MHATICLGIVTIERRAQANPMLVLNFYYATKLMHDKNCFAYFGRELSIEFSIDRPIAVEMLPILQHSIEQPVNIFQVNKVWLCLFSNFHGFALNINTHFIASNLPEQ